MKIERTKFITREDRERALRSISVGAFTDREIQELLKTDYLYAPASTKYHGAYSGGLFDHSYNVAVALEELTKRLDLHWENRYSPIRVGLLHDLCKVDQYHYDAFDNSYKYEDTLIHGHGDKSVIYAQSLTDLTKEEVLCIMYHMGSFTEEKEWKHYTKAIQEYPNVLWTHTADMIASQIMEVE